MSIGPTVLPVRDGQGISAPVPRHEHELTASAQSLDGEKHMVPRQIGTLPHDLYKVSRARVKHDVDHLCFHGCMLWHVPPLGEQNALLQEQ